MWQRHLINEKTCLYGYQHWEESILRSCWAHHFSEDHMDSWPLEVLKIWEDGSKKWNWYFHIPALHIRNGYEIPDWHVWSKWLERERVLSSTRKKCMCSWHHVECEQNRSHACCPWYLFWIVHNSCKGWDNCMISVLVCSGSWFHAWNICALTFAWNSWESKYSPALTSYFLSKTRAWFHNCGDIVRLNSISPREAAGRAAESTRPYLRLSLDLEWSTHTISFCDW